MISARDEDEIVELTIILCLEVLRRVGVRNPLELTVGHMEEIKTRFGVFAHDFFASMITGGVTSANRTRADSPISYVKAK